jgi:hypothetical protein
VRKWLAMVFGLLSVEALAAEVLAASVRGDYRKDEAYTQLYQRMNSDGNPVNNYSFPGAGQA